MSNMRKADLPDMVEYVYESLERAAKYRMQPEVIASAMVYLKSNPSATIEECFDAAFQEWDLQR